MIRAASPSVREALAVSTGALLVGASVSLLDDQPRFWLMLTALAAAFGSYGLIRVGRDTIKGREANSSGLPRPIIAIYVAGLSTGGLLVLRPGDALTVSDLLFLVSFALCVMYLMRGEVPVRSITPWIGFGVAIFAVGALVSSLGALQVGESLGTLARFGFVAFAWLWLGVQVMSSWSMVRICMAAWAFAGALTATGAVMQAVFGDVIPGTAIAWGRMTGFTQNVNDLGGICAVALPISMSLVSDAIRNHRETSVIYLALGLINLAGLILSGSVGGFAAATIGLGVFALTTRWSTGLILAALIASAVATALVVAFGIGTSLLVRYGVVTGPAGDPTATLWTRLETISAAWQVLQRQPLIGVGLAPGGAVTDTGFAVHNVFIAAWYQAGILGLVGITLLVGLAIAEGGRALGRITKADRLRDVVAGIAGSTASALALGLGSPVLYQRYFWLPIAMTFAIRALPEATASTKRLVAGD